MPTISFTLKDLQELVGKKIVEKDLPKLMEYAKGDFEEYNEKTGEVKVSLQDTNLPYLWSVEGLSRIFKGALGAEKGLPKINVEKNEEYKIIVDKSIHKIRPFIAGFVAKGNKIDDYQIKQMIQLQEKLCDTYGRKRRKVSVGLYSYQRIKFPVHYKAVEPNSVRFTPLESAKEMSLKEILLHHPTGKEYAFILQDFDKYPIFIDSNNKVLSFAPIINSDDLGRLEVGDENIFFECTGDDFNAVMLTCNIFAYAFFDRGFKIHSVKVDYGDKKVDCPYEFKNKITVSKEQIKSIYGLDLSEKEIKDLFESGRYGYDKNVVNIPDYRQDIMHSVDAIEDLGIMYGFDKMQTEPLKSYTIGETLPIIDFIDKIRDIMVGFGYQEVMSPILTNKKVIFENMNINSEELQKQNLEELKLVEIKSFMSENFSVVRSWLLPIMMEVLSKNKHCEYPQKIFEEGLVTSNKENGIFDYELLAFVSAHNTATFNEVKQILDSLVRSLDVKFDVSQFEHSSFISGRCGKVSLKGKNLGFLGEIHPKVLSNWGIEVPVVGLELNLTELFEIVSKK